MVDTLIAFIRENFVEFQVMTAILLVLLLWVFGRPREKSRFRLREADRYQTSHSDKLKKNPKEPRRLGGIRIDRKPHEILGISVHADKRTINKAYRDLMRQYHPDKVAEINTEQWEAAQEIASAINDAKVEMLKKLDNQSS